MKFPSFDIAGFPGVIGCIACTHIPIALPRNVVQPAAFTNHKGYPSLNVQVLCDHKMLIANIVARWPGSILDCRVFRNSRLYDALELRQDKTVVLGNNTYACETFLLTPVLWPTNEA